MTENASTSGIRGAWAPRIVVVSGTAAWALLTLTFAGLGSSPRDAALVAIGIVIQWATGTILWTAVRRGLAPLLEALGVGLVLGPILAVLAGVVGNAVVNWAWWWLLPSVGAGIVWWTRRFNVHRQSADGHNISGLWWPVAAGFVVGLALLWLNLRRYPLSWQGVWDRYHPDMIFFEALSYSVANFGPSDSIFMVGGDIRYHWLTYAWSGQLSSAFDAAPFMVLTRVLPVVALLGLVLLAVALVDLVARDQSNRARMWARWIAVALVIPGGYLGAVNGTLLNFDSPSQALTSAWVLAWTVVAVVVVTRPQVGIWLWMTLALLAFAITGGKVSAGVVIGAGIAIAALVGVFLRRTWWRALLTAAVITVFAVGLAGLLFAWGSASPGDLRFLQWDGRASTIQGLNSSTGPRGVFLGTAGLLVAMTARWAGGVFLLGDGRWRARPEPWLGVGLVLAGVLPVILFAQGVNETWFALTASAPLAVLSAVGITVGWEKAGLGRGIAVGALLAGVVGFLAVSYIWTDQVWESGLGRFWSPWIGLAVAGFAGLLAALMRRQKAALTFIAVAVLVLIVEAALSRGTPIVAAAVGGARDGAGIRASQLADPGLVGTSEVDGAGAPAQQPNEDPLGLEPDQPAPAPADARPVHAWSPDHQAAAEFLRNEAGTGDVIVTNEVDAFLVPALTRRQAFISGSPYQALYGSTAAAELIPGRLAENAAFLEARDPAIANEVCDSGARWVWFAADRTPSINPDSLGAVALSNDSVTIIRLNSTTCPR